MTTKFGRVNIKQPLNIYNEGKSIFQEILCEQFKQVSALMMNNILMTRTITFKYECTVIYVS